MRDFYAKQYAWSRIYEERGLQILDSDRRRVAAVDRHAGPGPKRILELGCGGGWTGAALADEGHEVVAVDREPRSAANARALAAEDPARSLRIIEEDFYEVEVPAPFDVVCYFDGFGVGTDEDQRRLLRRIDGWLRPSGCALIDVLTPWYWRGRHGMTYEFGEGVGRYEFEAEGCRMVDRLHHRDMPGEIVLQSIRCYSPADLRLLLDGIGLELDDTEAFDSELYEETVPLRDAMLYLARLKRR